jgi:hypothetical protein
MDSTLPPYTSSLGAQAKKTVNNTNKQAVKENICFIARDWN